MVRLAMFSLFASMLAVFAMGPFGAADSSEWDGEGGQRIVLAQAAIADPVRRPGERAERPVKARNALAKPDQARSSVAGSDSVPAITTVTQTIEATTATAAPGATEIGIPDVAGPDLLVTTVAQTSDVPAPAATEAVEIKVDTAANTDVPPPPAATIDVTPVPATPAAPTLPAAEAAVVAPDKETPAPAVAAPTDAAEVKVDTAPPPQAVTLPPPPKPAADTTAVAKPAVAPKPAPPSAIVSEYRLTAGDKVTVTVFGQTDLSGEYLIDDGGNITLPLAGVVPVAGATIKESENNIAQSLANGFIRQPSVSVRMSEHRPIFVVGDVKTPGSYPYRYGATVLSAVAVAGGYGVAEAMPGVAAAEFMLVDERVRVLEATRLTLLVRQARVTAQLENKTAFEAPYVPGIAYDSAQLDQIVMQERQVMASQIEALTKETGLQKSQKPRIESEITSLIAQTEGQKRQLTLVIEQAEDYAKLDKMGLTRRATEVAMQREKAALESTIASLDAARARLGLMLGEIDIKIQDLEIANHRRLVAEMQDIRQKLQEIDTQLPVVHELRQLRAQLAGGIMGVDGEEIQRAIFIMRTKNGSVKTVAATPDMMLEPGDIVEVKRTRLRGIGVNGRQPISSAPAGRPTTYGIAVPPSPNAAVAENVAPR